MADIRKIHFCSCRKCTNSSFLPLLPSTFNRDVRHRDPVLLLVPALPGHAQLDHLRAHVQFRHVAHHHCPPCFREYHLQPELWWGVARLFQPTVHKIVLSLYFSVFYCRRCVHCVSKQRPSRAGHLSWAHYRSAVWWSKSLSFTFNGLSLHLVSSAHILCSICRDFWNRPIFSMATTRWTKYTFQISRTICRWPTCWSL